MKYPKRKPKWQYYAKNVLRRAIPAGLFRFALGKRLSGSKRIEEDVLDRVNYYNKLNEPAALGSDAIKLKDLPAFKSPKAYGFDTYEYTRYFDESFRANFLFGDVIHIPPEPSIQKSRPINGDNKTAVLLNLDKYRHFIFVKDEVPFQQKKDMLIGRGVITQPHRIRFMQLYFGHPLCNLGQINTKGGNAGWIKPKMSIADHLEYKFILSLEGNDVATNLKWIMSSNSVAIMPRPRYETWFMEGRLIPDHHYIIIKDDYSDLEERLNYFISNPHEAQQIAKNANTFVQQFLDKRKEDLISLLVLQKYFKYTGQLP